MRPSGNLEGRRVGRTRLARVGGALAALLATAAVLVAAPAGASSQDVHFTLTPIYFGPVVLGTSTTNQSVVTNKSLQPIYFISASPGVNNTGAEFHASIGTCVGAIAPQTTCDLSVVFQPNAKGLRVSTLTARFGEKNSSGVIIKAASVSTRIQGRGQPPTFTLTGGSAGDVKVGSYGSVSATVTNTSTVPLTVRGYHLSNVSDGAFTLSSDTCPTPVLPGGSCSIVSTFHPHRLGNANATLNVSMFVSGVGASIVYRQATLLGRGVAVSGHAPLQLTSLFFGRVTVGTTASGSVVLTNTSLHAETLVSTSLENDASGAYTITGNNCSTPIAPGSSCDLTVTYAPAADVTHNATLVAQVSFINSHGVKVTVSAQTTLSGTGVNPNFTLQASSFPTTTVGASSAGSVTVTNTSLVALNYSSTAFQGSDPSVWAQSGSTCTGPIAPSTSCVLAITFSPRTQGTEAITIQVTLDLTVRAHTEYVFQRAALAGHAVLPTFKISAVSLPSTPKDVPVTAPATITNTSSVSLSYDGFTMGGANAADFTVTGSTCSGLIGPGGTCQLTVQFTPSLSAPGTEHASLKVIMLIAGVTPAITTSDNRYLTGTES